MSDIISRLILRTDFAWGKYETSRQAHALGPSSTLRSPRAPVAPNTAPKREFRHRSNITSIRGPRLIHRHPARRRRTNAEQTTPNQKRQRPVSSACQLMAATFPTTSLTPLRTIGKPPGPARIPTPIKNESAPSIDTVAHLEPLPESTWQFPMLRKRQLHESKQVPVESLTMPGYTDSMPLLSAASPGKPTIPGATNFKWRRVAHPRASLCQVRIDDSQNALA